MNGKRILDALGSVNEAYIEEAAPGNTSQAKKRRWVKWGALAACLFLVLGGALFLVRQNAPSSAGAGVTVSEDGVTIPPADVTLALQEDSEACWAYPFFIYQGRCYKGYTTVYGDVDLIGEYLGTAAGLLDVWTPKEGYVDLAGNVEGDFYSVNGYDSGFMLCMRRSNGGVLIFLNDNDLTLKYGSDLLEGRLHLSSQMEEVRYQDRASWFDGTDEIFTLDRGAGPTVDAFVTALDQGPFMRIADLQLEEGQNSIYDSELYHVTFRTNDGLTVPLHLLEGGYVHFGAYFNGVCIKVDEAVFNAWIALLDSRTHTAPAEPEPSSFLTLEDCRDDTWFGGFLPSYAPEGIPFQHATRSYVIEPKTGRLVKTKEIWLTYSGGDGPADAEYSIQLCWTEDYGENGWAGPILDRAELTPDAIAPFISTTRENGSPKTRSDMSFGVSLSKDVMAVFHGYALDAKTADQILTSIPE